jgi:hypothetical protein
VDSGLPAVRGGDPIHAQVFTGRCLGWNEDVHPKPVRFIRREVERYGSEPGVAEGLPGYRMPEGNQRVGIPFRPKVNIPKRPFSEMKLMLPEEASVLSAQLAIARAHQVPRLNPDPFDPGIGP